MCCTLKNMTIICPSVFMGYFQHLSAMGMGFSTNDEYLSDGLALETTNQLMFFLWTSSRWAQIGIIWSAKLEWWSPTLFYRIFQPPIRWGAMPFLGTADSPEMAPDIAILTDPFLGSDTTTRALMWTGYMSWPWKARCFLSGSFGLYQLGLLNFTPGSRGRNKGRKQVGICCCRFFFTVRSPFF